MSLPLPIVAMILFVLLSWFLTLFALLLVAQMVSDVWNCLFLGLPIRRRHTLPFLQRLIERQAAANARGVYGPDVAVGAPRPPLISPAESLASMISAQVADGVRIGLQSYGLRPVAQTQAQSAPNGQNGQNGHSSHGPNGHPSGHNGGRTRSDPHLGEQGGTGGGVRWSGGPTSVPLGQSGQMGREAAPSQPVNPSAFQ